MTCTCPFETKMSHKEFSIESLQHEANPTEAQFSDIVLL